MSIQLGKSDCGGEISEKQSLWGVEISPTGNLNTRQHLKIKKKDVYLKYISVLRHKENRYRVLRYLGCILPYP